VSKKNEDGLAKFAKAIKNPQTRQDFANKKKTLEDLGVDIDNNKVKNYLNRLSIAELNTLADLQTTMETSGDTDMIAKTQGGHSLAKL
jgi:hypothetical protein